jgi:hypothetical protein
VRPSGAHGVLLAPLTEYAHESPLNIDTGSMLTHSAAAAGADTLVGPGQARANLYPTFGPTGMVALRAGPVPLALQTRRAKS